MALTKNSASCRSIPLQWRSQSESFRTARYFRPFSRSISIRDRGSAATKIGAPRCRNGSPRFAWETRPGVIAGSSITKTARRSRPENMRPRNRDRAGLAGGEAELGQVFAVDQSLEQLTVIGEIDGPRSEGNVNAPIRATPSTIRQGRRLANPRNSDTNRVAGRS